MNIRKKRKAQGIPIAAMGDIAFLLLIFYVATTMVTDQKPHDVKLPVTPAGVKASPYPLIIYLDRETAARNSVYFFNRSVPLDNLGDQVLEKAAMAPANLRVYLSIQQDLPYRYMNDVIGALKKAGIRQLVITTRPPAQGEKQ